MFGTNNNNRGLVAYQFVVRIEREARGGCVDGTHK